MIDRRFGILALLILLQGCAAGTTIPCDPKAKQSTADSAWWLTQCFDVKGDRIEGLPVSTIDPSWTAAMVLTRRSLPSVAGKHDFCDSSLRFEFDGDFNEDGRADQALVGVYRDRSNKTGQFLLVLSRSTTGKWTPAFVSKQPGRAAFSILSYKDRELGWWMCCACDNGVQVQPKGTSYALKPFDFRK